MACPCRPVRSGLTWVQPSALNCVTNLSGPRSADGAQGKTRVCRLGAVSVSQLGCPTCVTRPLQAMSRNESTKTAPTESLQGHSPLRTDQSMAGIDVAVATSDLRQRNSSGALAHRLTQYREKFHEVHTHRLGHCLGLWAGLSRHGAGRRHTNHRRRQHQQHDHRPDGQLDP